MLGHVLERLSDAFLALDREWRPTYLNQAAERLVGRARAELLGERLWDVFPELVGSGLQELLQRALAEQQPACLEDYFPLFGRWYAVHVYPSADGLSVLFEDVSVRKAAELERDQQIGDLEAERALLGEVIQQMPAGVTIVEAPGGRVLMSNRVMAGLWPGLAAADARLEECVREIRACSLDGRPYRPEDSPVLRTLRTGEPVEGEEVVVEGEGERRIFSVTAGPVRDLGGRLVAAVITVREVTQRRQHELREHLLSEVSALLNSTLDYPVTVQGIAQLCATYLAEYCVVHVEDAGAVRGLGIAHTDPAKEQSFRELLRLFPVGTDQAHPVVEVLRTGATRLIQEMDEATLEILAGGRAHLDRMRSLELRSALIVPLNARGRTLGAISLTRTAGAAAYTDADVALVEALARRAALAVDNARLYREARRAAEARERTLGVVSHDLRNTLNAAVIQAELLLDPPAGGGPEGRERRQLESLRRSLGHMHRMVQDLLDAESIEAGRLSLRPTPLDPATVAGEVGEGFAPLARERGIDLRLEVPATLPRVLGDHVRLIQVLSNLLTNALDFTPRGGAVAVGAERLGSRICFHVRDTGIGIAAADVPRVFEKHWRGGGSPHHHAGSGLGLAIVRGIVQAHGGEVWVSSTPGQGSTFSFTMPAAPEAGG